MSEEEYQNPPQEKKEGRGQVTMTLSGMDLAYDGTRWYNLTDPDKLQAEVHPVVAENINLKKRKELLVRLIAEKEYAGLLVDREIAEAKEVISMLEESLGIPHEGE